jgi:hypothetical protein
MNASSMLKKSKYSIKVFDKEFTPKKGVFMTIRVD